MAETFCIWKMKHTFILAALWMTAQGILGQNPIIRDQFTADPTARVFGERIYLFPSHDILPPEGQRQNWFCMEDYHVFSSENLVDWTDHGVIVSQQQVPWGKQNGYSMWAPDCVERGGKYYFYFPNAPQEGRGFAVGVAVADRPEGPYKLEPEPIRGVSGIDPCVLMDTDGQAYLYWGSMMIRGARLKDNMKELDGEPEEMKGLPEGFKEGPFAFRRGGWYYLTFPWVRKEKGTETLAYAMSHSPLGPWDFKGIIMEEHANACWTNHHSLVEYKGQWYLFYHHNDYSPNDDKRRSVCIEKIAFNADGSIRPVVPTRRGVGITPATSRVEVDRFSVASNSPSSEEGVSIAFNDTVDTFHGWHVTLPKKGSWLQYNDVDFSMVTDGYLIARVKADDNTEFFVREKSSKGKVIAKVAVVVKSEQGPFRRDRSGQWLTVSVPLNNTPKGVVNLILTCEGKGFSIDWLQFKNRPLYFSPVADVSPASPDEQGFIRRWRMREPVRQEIGSNVVFTNTWLRKLFAEERAKLSKNKGKWYNMDSENYHVRLFRFAEKYGQQLYGNLFWCETVIDCPADIPDVRLAAGSNGASMWWLDDEELLLLEGDRRMVQDDGVSQRITLSKGRHVLRCAVVNGPGLSDFCIRFVDEKGNPITNYTVNIPK